FKLTPLKEKWDQMDTRRQEMQRLDRGDKKLLYESLMGRWNKEGIATSERLKVVPKRLEQIMRTTAQEERERRDAAGDPNPVNADSLCPFLKKTIGMRDTF